MNDTGQIAYQATLSGAGVSSSNDVGLWRTDESGMPQLIVREGDELDVDPGPGTDLRTVQVINLQIDSGGQDGRRSGMNNNGELTFVTFFTDGTSAVWTTASSGPCSPADMNDDGNLNNTDINLFVQAFLAQQAPADINGDGNFNNTDINLFVQAFLAGGCP